MTKLSSYVYRAEGHTYLLVPDFTIFLTKVWMTGCQILNLQQEYLGYWDRHNMPPDLIRQLNAFIRRENGQEIASRRNAILRKERKPKF